MQDNSTDLFGNQPTKFCKFCKQRKPLDDFRLIKSKMRNGVRYGSPFRHCRCKACCAAEQKKWKGTPNGISSDAATRRRTDLKREYGLTELDYHKMLQDQNGVCAICGKPETNINPRKRMNKVRNLAVDHDHITGKIRKLLCVRCNTGMGRFDDDPEILRRAADYIEQHR